MQMRKQFVRACAVISISLLATLSAGAQQPAADRPWREVRIENAERLPQWESHQGVFRLVRFNADRVWQAALPAPHADDLPGAPPAVINLPMPDGSAVGFEIVEYDVLADDSQARFPWIRTYYGWAIRNPAVTIRLTVSDTGVHAQVADPKLGTILIDPLGASLDDEHVAHYKRDHLRGGFTCNVIDVPEAMPNDAVSLIAPDDPIKLRRITMTLAGTAEWGAEAGSAGANYTQRKALALVNLTDGVNRMNQLYERDLGVRLKLTSGNDKIVFVVKEAIGDTHEKQTVSIAAAANATGTFKLKFSGQSTGDIKLGTDTPATIKGKLELLANIGSDPTGVSVTKNDGTTTAIVPGDKLVVEFNGPLVKATNQPNMTAESPTAGTDVSANVTVTELAAGTGIAYPFSGSDNDALGTQNHAFVKALKDATEIGDYQMGHALHFDSTFTGGAGSAFSPAVCIDAKKADAATVHKIVKNDPYWIDFIAHELGHLLGASHTFNGKKGSCSGTEWKADHAYEPGSGTTIMAYAGICGTDNVQDLSDDHFHVESIIQVNDYFAANAGCGTLLDAPPNKQPGADFDNPANTAIPKQTPFWIKVKGSDLDAAQTLSFCVEQFDKDGTNPAEIGDPDDGKMPLFRSMKPTLAKVRFFPRMDHLLGKALPAGEKKLAETLPSKARDMKMRVTARDNLFGTHHKEATFKVVEAAGPFKVNDPKSVEYHTCVKVKWDVANTDTNADITADKVRILLSTDGGESFKKLHDTPLPATLVELVAETANNGEKQVDLPNQNIAKARIMVHAKDRIFFAISPEFKIKVAPPAPVGAPTCTGDVDGNSSVNVDDLLAIINAWGVECACGCSVDIDNSGSVNIDDLLAVINFWGECPPS